MAKAEILVVEDESIVARDLASRLEQLDYAVTALAASGPEAIRKATETLPDLVLMDVRLRGDMDGIEAAQQIRECLSVPVVYLTAYSDENTLQRAKITEPFGYILKPFEEQGLYMTIEMALYKHRMEEELRRHRDHLEELVEERTAELVSANDQLRRRATLDRLRLSIYEMREAADIREVLASLYDALRDLDVDFENCSVQIVDEEKETFQSYALTPERVLQVPAFPLAGSAVYAAFRYGRPVYRRDLDAADKYGERERLREDFEQSIRSVLDVPFSHGTLAINSLEPEAFPNQDIGAVGMLARVLSEAYARHDDIQRIEASEERYRTLIETSPDAITVADLGDHLIMANQQAARIHGFESPEEMVSSVASTFELIAPEDRPRAMENVQKTLETGSVRDVEYTFLRKDGGTFPAELSASLIVNGDSTPKAFGAVTRDITERKQIEDRIQQHQRLAAVGQLAAGIAHDFNNILTGIIGYAQLLNMHPDLPQSLKDDLGSIETEGQRAAYLIRQVLDFSRQSAIRRQPLDLVSFLKESLKFLKRMIPENVHIFVETASDEYLVQADPTQIQQVVTNLAVNARDAMPRGGELRFKVSIFRPDSEEALPFPDMPPIEWVVLTASDTGAGISPEIRSRIFDPFFTTKEVGEGTGLGLAQVYGIVMQHEGFIDVQSEVDQGTTFRVYLPRLVSDDADEEATEDRKEIPRGTETLLLVEDEDLVLNVGREILMSLGYTVLPATSGEEALGIYRARGDEIGLVVMDMVMPGMDGEQTYRALAEINPEVRVVLISGYSLPSSIEELWSSGIRDFVQKPFRYPVLARAVRNALDGA